MIHPNTAAKSGARLETRSVLAVEVLVSASMKQVNIIAHIQPENKPGQPIDLTVENKFFFCTKTIIMATVMAQKRLRQNVTSKLFALSKWRVNTPAILQQKQHTTKVTIALVFTEECPDA
jgi:hypothetical protein